MFSIMLLQVIFINWRRYMQELQCDDLFIPPFLLNLPKPGTDRREKLRFNCCENTTEDFLNGIRGWSEHLPLDECVEWIQPEMWLKVDHTTWFKEVMILESKIPPKHRPNQNQNCVVRIFKGTDLLECVAQRRDCQWAMHIGHTSLMCKNRSAMEFVDSYIAVTWYKVISYFSPSPALAGSDSLFLTQYPSPNKKLEKLSLSEFKEPPACVI